MTLLSVCLWKMAPYVIRVSTYNCTSLAHVPYHLWRRDSIGHVFLFATMFPQIDRDDLGTTLAKSIRGHCSWCGHLATDIGRSAGWVGYEICGVSLYCWNGCGWEWKKNNKTKLVTDTHDRLSQVYCSMHNCETADQLFWISVTGKWSIKNNDFNYFKCIL